jgi:hypothetical protein
LKSVFVFEHYRPRNDGDQLLIEVSNIDYVTEGVNDAAWIESKGITYYDDSSVKLIAPQIDISEIPQLINDFIFHNKIEQPCTLSLYAIKTTGAKYLPVVIRNILEHNLSKG